MPLVARIKVRRSMAYTVLDTMFPMNLGFFAGHSLALLWRVFSHMENAVNPWLVTLIGVFGMLTMLGGAARAHRRAIMKGVLEETGADAVFEDGTHTVLRKDGKEQQE